MGCGCTRGLKLSPVSPLVAEAEVSCEAPATHDCFDQSTLTALHEKYCKSDSLVSALKSDDTKLVKGSFLQEVVRCGKPIDRRQELTPKYFWQVDKLVPEMNTTQETRNRGVCLVGLSYCWASKEHPDPNAVQLKWIAQVLEKFLDIVDDAALFIDWCSLYQRPHSESQLEAFKRSLKDVNLWYAHQLVWVWILNRALPGVRPYDERGWPCFERAVTAFIKDQRLMLDIGMEAAETSRSWGEIVSQCTKGRSPPKIPNIFNDLLETKIFTNGVDVSFVKNKYAQTFVEVLASAEQLDYSHLGWGDTEAAQVFDLFPWCHSLKRLEIGFNKITDVSGLCSVLESSRVQHLDLRGNPLRIETVNKLKDMWKSVGLTDKGLQLSADQVLGKPASGKPKPQGARSPSPLADRGSLRGADQKMGKQTSGRSKSQGTRTPSPPLLK